MWSVLLIASSLVMRTVERSATTSSSSLPPPLPPAAVTNVTEPTPPSPTRSPDVLEAGRPRSWGVDPTVVRRSGKMGADAGNTQVSLRVEQYE